MSLTWESTSGLNEKIPKDSGFQVLLVIFPDIFKNSTICFNRIDSNCRKNTVDWLFVYLFCYIKRKWRFFGGINTCNEFSVLDVLVDYIEKKNHVNFSI